MAFSVRPLEDMNEITSHMLEVVQAHMALSKPQTMVRKCEHAPQKCLSLLECKNKEVESNSCKYHLNKRCPNLG